jgi:hypothetical protein
VAGFAGPLGDAVLRKVEVIAGEMLIVRIDHAGG